MSRVLARANGEGAVEADKKRAVVAQRLARLESAHPKLPVLQLRRRYALTRFEEDVLWLAAAVRIDGHLGQVIANLCEAPGRDYVTPWVCAQLFAEDRAQRLSLAPSFEPSATLFDRRLLRAQVRPHGAGNPLHVELVPASFLTTTLSGRRSVGPELARFARRTRPLVGLEDMALRPQVRDALGQMASTLELAGALDDPRFSDGGYDFQRATGLMLSGPGGSGKTLAARAMCKVARRRLIEVDADQLSGLGTVALQALDALFVEAEYHGEWLLFDGCNHMLREPPADHPIAAEANHALIAAFGAALQRHSVTVVITTDSPDHVAGSLRERMTWQYTMAPLARISASEAWIFNTPSGVSLADDIDLEELSQSYTLTGRGIQGAMRLALAASGGPTIDAAALELGARAQQSSGMGRVARRTWVSRERADLKLESELSASIDEIIATERVREKILHDWGLGAKMQKGLGLICLFDGEPGTGKTMAAEVIASELNLPLYTVNVANVVSKWIGETEKNLERIFADAERNRCVLLFDEADTLFAKRTSVQRSTDRYSNMEIGLLLQLVENYRGLVLLTTNLKDSIDPAFGRRFAFKLSFEFPEAEVREAIWRNLLPEEHIADDIAFEALGYSYELSGGSIRTVVLRAAYRAGMMGQPVTREILEECALQECRSLGRLVREYRGDWGD